MPDIVSDDDSIPGSIVDSDDDSLPGLIDDSDSDDDSDVTIRHVLDAFHRDQESTLQTVPFKEFTLRAEPLLLVLWTKKHFRSISFSLAAAIGYLCNCVWKTTYRGC
jgi:hypothetical protein